MKKFFSYLGVLLLLLPFLFTPMQAIALVMDSSGKSVSFTIQNKNGQDYSLAGIQIEVPTSENDAYKTLNINIPVGYKLETNIAKPTSWNMTVDDKAISFINSNVNQYLEVSDIQKVLASIVLTKDDSLPENDGNFTPGKLKIIISKKLMSSRTDAAGISHYYEFNPGAIPWTDAYNEAKNSEYRSLKGYLATITSQEEQNFIYNSIAKYPGWLGGTRAVWQDLAIKDPIQIDNQFSMDLKIADKWYWADGPEAGQIFYNTPTRSDAGPLPGAYENFDGIHGEPNNTASSEAFLQFAVDNSDTWNDLSNTMLSSTFNQGFYVEYSEYGDQKATDSSDTFEASIPGPVIVHHVDEAGNPLTDDETLEGNLTALYKTEQKKLTGYTLKDVTGSPEGQFMDQSQVITYRYTKDPILGKPVIVHYQDQTGQLLSDDAILKGNVGETYKAEQKTISGYTFKEVKGNPEALFSDQDQVVTYVYIKNDIPKQDNSKNEPNSTIPDGEGKLPLTGEKQTMLIIVGLSLVFVTATGIVLSRKKIK